jgi:hypothetical protein
MSSFTVRCIYCGAELVLNDDSEEARTAGTDPWQQMRKHVLGKHLLDGEVNRHQYRFAWLADMLFFRCPADPARWEARIHIMLKHHLEDTK